MSEMNLYIRLERPADYPAIDSVIRTAFGRPTEATLVTLIRRSPQYRAAYSMVAVIDLQIVGHIMMSNITIDDGCQAHPALCLAPLAVVPTYHKRGVGTALITSAIQATAASNENLVVVLGNPAYYARFGFQPALSLGVDHNLPAHVPSACGMALPLSHYDPALRGAVIYPKHFDITR